MDLHIIGAGPAGSISAISAIRKKNARVVISEEHSCAGIPTHCSGLFSIDGLESLKEFFDYKKTLVNRINGAIVDVAGEELVIDAKKDIALVCNRAEVDGLLAKNAESEGARINYGERITRLNQLNADNVIGADGPHSFVATQFKFPRIKKFVSTLQAKVSYSVEDYHKVRLFVSNEKFPGFFGWVIPHNEETAEFGCGVALPHNVNKAFGELLKINGVHSVPKPSGAVIPIEVRKRTAMHSAGKNILLVGDAAGQVKATTGGGVIFGGNCAKIAGEHFSNSDAYENKWRGKFGFDLFLHSIVHDYIARKKDEQLRRICRKLKAADIEDFLSKKGHMDKPSKMVGADTILLLTKGLF